MLSDMHLAVPTMALPENVLGSPAAVLEDLGWGVGSLLRLCITGPSTGPFTGPFTGPTDDAPSPKWLVLAFDLLVVPPERPSSASIGSPMSWSISKEVCRRKRRNVEYLEVGKSYDAYR